MADRYAVAAGGNWDTTSTWSDVSGGAGGFSVPLVTDDVFLDAASGNVTINVGSSCLSLNCTGYTGTLTHNGSIQLTIGQIPSGAGNIALKLVPGMTYTPVNALSTLTFRCTNATPQTIETAGHTLGKVDFSGAGGTWQQVDAITNTTGTINLLSGTWDTNNQTVTCAGFTTSGTLARTLTMGSSTINLSGGWTASAVTNFTVTANTAQINFTVAATLLTISKDYNGASFTMNGATAVAPGSGQNLTCANFTRTGVAVRNGSLILNGTITCTDTFTVDGDSATNRVLVSSNVIGTNRRITAATVSSSNTDFRDITGAGAASWDLSAIAGGSGDCGANIGITFTTAATQTATGTASFTWATHGWTSRVPLPQDDVVIPNAFVAGRTVTMDMPRAGNNVTFSCTGSPNVTSTIYLEVYGDLTFPAGMGVINLGSNGTSFIGPSPATLITNGNTILQSGGLNLDREALMLGDPLVTGGLLRIRNLGYIDTQDFDVTASYLPCLNTSGVNLFGSSTVTLTYTTTSTGTILDFFTATSARVSAANADFIISGAGAGNRNVTLAGAEIGSLTYDVADSPGSITLSDGTIGTLTLGPGRTLAQNNASTLHIGTTINATGEDWGYVRLDGATGGFISAPDSAALSVTGDIDLRFYGAAYDWSRPGLSGALADKRNVTNEGSWLWYMTASGGMTFITLANGIATAKTFNSTSSVPFADGQDGWVRVTLDVDDGVGNAVCIFWTSTDGSTWTQLGTTLTSAGVTSIFDGTSILRLGAQGTATGFFGKVYRFQVRNNILDDGSGIVFDADLTTKPFGADTFTESSPNGATVSLVNYATDGAIRFRPSGGAEISKASGTIEVTNASIRFSTATGGAIFNAIDSYDAGGNTGWNFLASSNGDFLPLL